MHYTSYGSDFYLAFHFHLDLLMNLFEFSKVVNLLTYSLGLLVVNWYCIHLEKERLAKEKHKLHALRHKAKIHDAALFPENVGNSTENSEVHKLREYITMNKEAIL